MSDISIIFSFGLIPFTKVFSLVNTIQFAFRFNIIAMPLLTIVLTYCICNLQRITYIVTVTFIYLYCACNLIFINSTVVPYYVNDTDTLEQVIPSFSRGDIRDYVIIQGTEYLPVMDEKGDFYYPEALLIKTLGDNYDYQIIYSEKNGDWIPLPYERTGTQITFEYNSKGSELLMLPLTHYKGYKVYAIDSNNSKQELKVINPQRYKQVCFNTLKGNYKYVCHYDGTIIQHVSLIVSILTLVFTLLNIIFKRIKNLKVY